MPELLTQDTSVACASNSPKTRPKCAKAVTEIKELQRLLMNDARKGDKFGAIRAQIARAYRDLQDMRLRMAMKPAPKPIDVTKPTRKRRPAPGLALWTDPTAPPKA